MPGKFIKFTQTKTTLYCTLRQNSYLLDSPANAAAGVLLAELIISINVERHIVPPDLLSLELFEHLRAV